MHLLTYMTGIRIILSNYLVKPYWEGRGWGWSACNGVLLNTGSNIVCPISRNNEMATRTDSPNVVFILIIQRSILYPYIYLVFLKLVFRILGCNTPISFSFLFFSR